jgi:peptide/nickel transport system permease protein
LALIGAFVLYASRHEHMRAPWRRVVRSRVGVATIVVLGFYVVVGLLDTVHFRLALDRQGDDSAETRYSPEVLSLLDVALSGLREREEKTYSAPFATHLFVKEAIEQPDGTLVRDFPRLEYGGAHLEDPARQRGFDIAWRAAWGALQGLVIWALLVTGILWLIARSRGGDARGDPRRHPGGAHADPLADRPRDARRHAGAERRRRRAGAQISHPGDRQGWGGCLLSDAQEHPHRSV